MPGLQTQMNHHNNQSRGNLVHGLSRIQQKRNF